MSFTFISKQFPTREICIARLEQVLWSEGPICPYCFSKQSTREKSQHRRHCNDCNTSYSVTVNTIFHNTKLPLQKWFFAISLMLDRSDASAKQLERDLGVTYKTAWYLATRIRRAMADDKGFLQSIVENSEPISNGPDMDRKGSAL